MGVTTDGTDSSEDYHRKKLEYRPDICPEFGTPEHCRLAGIDRDKKCYFEADVVKKYDVQNCNLKATRGFVERNKDSEDPEMQKTINILRILLSGHPHEYRPVEELTRRHAAYAAQMVG